MKKANLETNSKIEESCPRDASAERPSVSIFTSLWRLLRFFVKWITYLLFGYVGITLLGLFPVNQDFEPAPNGVRVYVYSGEVHSDIIVPVTNEVIDWRTIFPPEHFKAKTSGIRYVSIGWGDRGFFLNTPRWSDLTFSTAANATLLPSKTVLHVAFTTPRENESCREVMISADQYRKLVRFIRRALRQDVNGKPMRIDKSYHRYDAFYEANGTYHLFNTCNCWVAHGLRQAGVRTVRFAPMPKTVLWYLPDE